MSYSEYAEHSVAPRTAGAISSGGLHQGYPEKSRKDSSKGEEYGASSLEGGQSGPFNIIVLPQRPIQAPAWENCHGQDMPHNVRHMNSSCRGTN